MSATLGHSSSELYPTSDTSPSASPMIPRRQCSMPDLFKHTPYAASEEKSHDELSARARLLHDLLDSGRGLDNSVWCPEVCNMVRKLNELELFCDIL